MSFYVILQLWEPRLAYDKLVILAPETDQVESTYTRPWDKYDSDQIPLRAVDDQPVDPLAGNSFPGFGDDGPQLLPACSYISIADAGSLSGVSWAVNDIIVPIIVTSSFQSIIFNVACLEKKKN